MPRGETSPLACPPALVSSFFAQREPLKNKNGGGGGGGGGDTSGDRLANKNSQT